MVGTPTRMPTHQIKKARREIIKDINYLKSIGLIKISRNAEGKEMVTPVKFEFFKVARPEDVTPLFAAQAVWTLKIAPLSEFLCESFTVKDGDRNLTNELDEFGSALKGHPSLEQMTLYVRHLAWILLHPKVHAEVKGFLDKVAPEIWPGARQFFDLIIPENDLD